MVIWRRQGQRFTGWNGLIGGVGEICDGVGGFMMAQNVYDGKEDQQCGDGPQNHRSDAPIQFGKLEGDKVQCATGLVSQGRRLAEFFGVAEFIFKRGHDAGDVEFQERGVIADKAADVNGGGKGVEIALLKGAEMVGPNLGDFGDLVDGQASGFARQVELLGDRGHMSFLGLCGDFGNPRNSHRLRSGKAQFL